MQFIFRRRPDIHGEVAKLERYGIDEATCTRLANWLAGPAREIFRANPRLIAERIGLPERQVIRVLLHALTLGLVTLRWELRCPACGTVDPFADSLEQLHSSHDCPACRTNYRLDADDNVRVTFSADERLRPLDTGADDPVFRAEVDARHGIVTGHCLLTIQAFRDLFPNQTMPPSESMLIRRVAILFTDLAGSTALYVRRGDPRAFELVRQHFDRLFQAIDDHEGVVIKTIGDAVMGAFTSPAAAVRAACVMHEAVASLNEHLRLEPSDRLVLKVGLHVGPSISVNLNGRMDYFGTTVNTAARVQGTSKGNDIALSAAAFDDPEVAALLEGRMLDQAELLLKGLDAPMLVHHLRLLAEPASGPEALKSTGCTG